jgi:hypothetical protein
VRLKTRTIRHDDGSKIQVRTPADVLPDTWVSSRVRYNGVHLGYAYHRKGATEVHPVIGPYITNVSSVAEAARILVRANGGMK